MSNGSFVNIGKQINYEKRLKVVLSNKKYCTQIRYEMGLFSMRNLKIRLIYHGEMGKIGQLKLGSAIEPHYWTLRRRYPALPASSRLKYFTSVFEKQK
jgi:hypothetical protein